MPTLAAQLKREWTEMPEECFKTTTLDELNVGDMFIFMPSPGDNNGHGGFKGPFFIFIKQIDCVETTESGLPYHQDHPHCRCVRFIDKIVVDEPLHMPVLQIC